MEKNNYITRQAGDPMVFDVDLKWSLWTVAPEYWQEYAPEAFKQLTFGFGGAFDEHGDSITINTAPRKEIRFGSVQILPKENLVKVWFYEEFDDDPNIHEHASFPIPDSLSEFLQRVDEVENDLIKKVKLAFA